MADPVDPIADAKSRVGSPLNAKWHADGLLGVGGMGAVFAATHRNGSRAALKVLHIEFARDATVRERFLREARIANRIDHPARVPVMDDDVTDRGEPFLVMDLLEGETFSRLLKRNAKKLGVEETFRIFEVVLDLLARCHEAGIVHRDIKPPNIFITKAGQVKVLDFGIARIHDPREGLEATRAGTALGTPSFLAPEQAIGVEGVDGRADLFSVGACIYTALTGERLNQARSDAESFLLAATQPAPSIARAAPDLAPEVVAFVDKALAFDREHRFQQAGPMRSELVALLAALRVGQLGAAKPRRVAGVVVRGNEAIDDEEALSAEEKAKAIERLTALWKQLGNCMAGIRQYGWNHSQTTRGLQATFEDVVAALAARAHSIRWEIGPNGFTYDDVPVWVPERSSLDRIPYQLFSDGIRKIELREGITAQELREFMAILLLDRSAVAGEDDMATALWDRRFEHIAYMAVDSFAEGEGPDKEAFQDQVREIGSKARSFAQIDKDWDEQNLEGRALQLNLAAGLRESGDAAAGLALDAITRATLGAQLGKTADEWSARYVDAFVEAYLDTKEEGDTDVLSRALVEWTGDQVALKNFSEVFGMIDSLGAGFAAKAGGDSASEDFSETITKAMLPIDALRGVLADIALEARAGEKDKNRAASVHADLAPGIARGLSTVDRDGSLFPVVCQCYEAVRSEELERVLFAYVERWSTGREGELGALLVRANLRAALALVAMLAERNTPDALAAMDGALKNPHVEVRLEVLSHLPEAQAERVREEVQKIVDDPELAAGEALQKIGALRLVAAGPALVRRIKLASFHGLPLPERRMWLEAVGQLNARRAETLAIELVGEHPILPKESIEETRILATEVLGTTASQEALVALQAAARKRWWNSEALRDASSRAAELVAARIGVLGGPMTGAEEDPR